MMKYDSILFVSMPWATISTPLIGIGVLAGKLKKHNYKAKSYYFNILLAKKMGYSKYTDISTSRDWVPISEYIFSSLYFGNTFKQDIDFFNEIFGKEFIHQDSTFISELFNLKNSVIPNFMDECLEKVLCSKEQIIGFTSTFNQIFPSLLLAKKIKDRDRSKIILFGGANFHGEMGVEYSNKFSDIIDYVFTGEADNSIIHFLEYLNGLRSFENIDGIARGGNQINYAIAINNMSEVAVPDYSDYVSEIEEYFPGQYQTIVEGITFEASRGCWWGEKKHCTFCGLNSIGMKFREKPENALIEEILNLSEKYKTLSLFAVDNIISAKAYSGFLQKISQMQLGLSFFFEVKANLKRKEVYALACANVRKIQPGIESFSSTTLKLMKKGVTAIQNVQLLKFTAEYGINASYNIIYGFPGETEECYDENVKLVNRIMHLQPPIGICQVEVHRFSPMHFEKESFGFTDLRPKNYYKSMFPTGFIDLDKIAYFFFSDAQVLNDGMKSISVKTHEWRREERCLKFSEMGPSFIQVGSIKKGEVTKREHLDIFDSILMIQCDEVTHLNNLLSDLKNIMTREVILRKISILIDKGFMIREGDKFLNIIPFAIPVKPEAIEQWLYAAKSKALEISLITKE